nr:hypothetical protein [Tanacetum cinerariifolium]
MERGFLSQKGCRVGRGVKEKNVNRNKTNTSSGIGVSMKSDDNMNEDTPFGVASAVQECVTLSMDDMTVEKDKLSSLEDTTVLGSFPPLPTQATTSAGNAPGNSSYANVTVKPSGKKVNVRTLFTPRGNEIDMVVLVDSIHAISERFANTTYGFSYGRRWHTLLLLTMSSYAGVMIELRGGVELKDNIVMAMPKITIKGYYACNVHVEYEWKPPRCLSCKVFENILKECPKNTGVGEKKTMKKHSQTSRGIPVGLKMRFKPQKEYQPVPKKSTASSSGNKKKGVKPTIEVSNSKPFDVLNSVDNDGEFGTNSSNTPIGENINKIERKFCEGKLRLLDDDGNPLVPTGIVESNSELKVVFDETANLRISTSGKDGSDKGYGINSLLEQWRNSYLDNDDYDPYDDDMYKNHDMSKHHQSIYDDLDITVCGGKKK